MACVCTYDDSDSDNLAAQALSSVSTMTTDISNLKVGVHNNANYAVYSELYTYVPNFLVIFMCNSCIIACVTLHHIA